MQDVTTHIDRVTLYRNGALVVRRGEAAVGAVRVRGLPLLFSSDALRVRAMAGHVTSVRESCAVAGEDTPLPDFASEKRRLEREAQGLIDEKDRLEAEVEALAKMLPLPLGQMDTPRVVDTSAWTSLSRETSDLIVEKRAALQVLFRRMKRVSDERLRVMALAQADAAPPRFSRAVEFVVDTSGAFELEYFVAQARWVPSYALHLRGKNAELVVGAMVAQASGESWENVKLSFSTADLARDTTLPELTSWRIGRAQPIPRRAFRPLPNDLAALFAGYDTGPRGPSSMETSLRTVPPPSSPPVAMSARVEKSARLMAPVPLDEPVYDDEPMSGEGDAILEDDDVWDEVTPVRDSPERSRASTGAMPRHARMESARRPPMASLGGRGGGPPSPPTTARASAPLPPRLRYAYNRLAGPDEAQRGTLVPLDLVHRLSWFVEAHDVNAVTALRRAVASLAEAGQRLQNATLPPMTRALGDTFAATVFTSPARHTIPDDGVFWRVEATRQTSPFALELRTVPREAPEVYRFCVLPSSTRPMPFGPLAVFEDDVFRVTTTLESGAIGARPLEVNLGVDDDVRVMGRAVHVHQDEKGLVSQTSRITHTVKTTIRSTAREHRDVFVFDRLPVPDGETKDVKVELVEATPPAKKGAHGPDGLPLEGALSWRLVVQPGSTETIDARYTIDLPAKLELVGGNRRE